MRKEYRSNEPLLFWREVTRMLHSIYYSALERFSPADSNASMVARMT